MRFTLPGIVMPSKPDAAGEGALAYTCYRVGESYGRDFFEILFSCGGAAAPSCKNKLFSQGGDRTFADSAWNCDMGLTALIFGQAECTVLQTLV